jgi:hypothetical protein
MLEKQMVPVKTRSRIAADGTVTVPVGFEDIGREVDVTVTPVRGKMASDMTQEEWVVFVNKTAGSIDDPAFVRPEQLPLRPAPDFD